MEARAERDLLRALARQYLEVCAQPVQAERRDRWRRHNSLLGDRPLIYMRAFAFGELAESQCRCEDPFARGYEWFFRHQLYWASLDDDSIFEPWVTLNAAHRYTGWGLASRRVQPAQAGGAYKDEPALREPNDLARLRPPRHEIDEAATARLADRLHDLLGDLLPINLDRGPAYRMWTGDISTDLGHLRGIEHLALDMMDRPEWLHEVVGFMSAGILRCHQQAEEAGDWGLGAHQNQAMPYAEELADPAPNHNRVRRRELWGYMASQEYTVCSPAQFEEFLFRYQRPILEHFGLVAYGCCEDLTHKIGVLRQLPNLRRIAVSPFADVARCAEQIQRDYVFSYRPSPADMVGYGFDADRVRRILKADLQACRQCHVDLTLKDVETVQGDSDRPRRWVALARQVIDEVYG